MKKIIKYAIYLLLILAAFFATGERFIFHLSHFENTYFSLTFQYELFGQDDTSRLSKEKIYSALLENSFDVFFVRTEYSSNYQEKRMIYATPKALDILRSRGINDGLYHSLFTGDVEIILYDFLEIDNIYENDTFYYLGTVADAVNFKNITDLDQDNIYEIIDLNEKSGSEKGLYATLILIWGIVLVIVLIISLFLTALTRKEIFARMILGDDPVAIYISYVFCDSLVFIGLFFALSFFIGLYYPIQFKFSFQCLCLLFILITNALSQLSIITVTYKKEGVGNNSNRKLSLFTYLIKTLVCILGAIVLSANCLLVEETIYYLKQKDFFISNNSHNLYNFNYYTVAREEQELMDEKKAINSVWVDFDVYNNNSSINLFDVTKTFNIPAVLVNKAGIYSMIKNEYLSDNLSQKIALCNENIIYIFYPSGTSENDLQLIRRGTEIICLDGYESNTNQIKLYPYTGSSQVVSFDSTRAPYPNKLLNDPIIIYDNISDSYLSRYKNPLYFAKSALYPDVSQELLDEVLNTYKSNTDGYSIKTNALELYSYYRIGIIRSYVVVLGISLIILLLQCAIVYITIKLEYSLNGKELAVKKILGYSIFEQNAKFLYTMVMSLFLSVIFSTLLILSIDYGNIQYSIICAIISFVIELIMVMVNCTKLNRIRTIAVLKGAKYG